ncbi:hypothetical protein D3C76_1519050 [compost metagenome]
MFVRQKTVGADAANDSFGLQDGNAVFGDGMAYVFKSPCGREAFSGKRQTQDGGGGQQG